MKKKIFGSMLLVTILVCALWASPALALPSTYLFSGSGYGDLNGDPVFNEVSYQIALATNATTSVDTTTFSGVTYLLGLQGSVLLGPDAAPEPSNLVAYNGYAGSFLDNLYLSFDSNANSLQFGSFDLTQSTDPLLDPFGSLAFWQFDIGVPLDILANSGPTLYFDIFNGIGSMPIFEFTALMNTGDPTAPDLLTLGADTMTYTAPVPEPSTFVLIGVGIAGLGLTRRMRNRKQI